MASSNKVRKRTKHTITFIIPMILLLSAGSFFFPTNSTADVISYQTLATELFDETSFLHNFHFYGEQLFFETAASDDTYILTNIHNSKMKALEFSDTGLSLHALNAGIYQVSLAHTPLVANDVLTQTWYTIMRHGIAKQVTLFTDTNFQVYLQVIDVNELPLDVYDILIDPGHGGLDGGAQAYGLSESKEVLNFSLYLANQLETLGLKVKLTRTSDEDPASDYDFSLEASPYYSDGRITQVYDTQAKIMLSNHLNTTGSGTASGFQIYSSIFTDNALPLQISEELQAVGLTPSLLADESTLSDGTFKKSDRCEERLSWQTSCINALEDYFFIIRESGGQFTIAQKLVLYNNDYLEIPRFGAQALLLEYLFIDNYSENKAWQANLFTYADAVVAAITSYLEL